MQCCLAALVALFLPRVTLFFLWLLTGYLGRAYDSVLWPFLGFLFMPYTTLAYAAAMNEGGGLHGLWMALFILGILVDFGALGGGAAARRRRREERE